VLEQQKLGTYIPEVTGFTSSGLNCSSVATTGSKAPTSPVIKEIKPMFHIIWQLTEK
jgi:hypothetical protein